MTARFGLDEIDFMDDTAEDIEAIGVNKFQELMGGVTLDETDPRRKAFQSFAYVISMLGNNIDFTAKMNRLAYAIDNYLDLLGADKNVPRLKADYAKSLFRFEYTAIQNFTIPSGTRMNAGTVSFVSSESVNVTTESTYVDVLFTCEEPGTIGNGFLPGQITQIENPDDLPFVFKAYNLEKTAGGREVEIDDAYAERLRESNDGYAVAGPSDAYEYFAKSTNQNIVDVYAYSPSDAVVEIVILMANNEEPTEDELQAVLDVCSAKGVRPLTDKVQVTTREVVYYDLSVSYYVESVSIQSTIEDAVNEAVAKYQSWQIAKLGRGIDPSELYSLLQMTGAKRIVVSPNDYTPIEKNQIAVAKNVTVTCLGEII